jgi:hypothetical protein
MSVGADWPMCENRSSSRAADAPVLLRAVLLVRPPFPMPFEDTLIGIVIVGVSGREWPY